MSTLQGFIKLEAEPLFASQDFCQIDQLADLLFSDYEHMVRLHAEHETVIACWIASSMSNARLVRSVNLPIAVYQFTLDDYHNLAPEVQASLMRRQHTWLYFKSGLLLRAGSLSQARLAQIQNKEQLAQLAHGLDHCLSFPPLAPYYQAKLLKQVFAKLYHETQASIPQHCIERALHWQAMVTPKASLLSATIKLIRRAVNRQLALQHETGQVTQLEPHHVAEVFADWEQLSVVEILRPDQDPEGMKQYLSNHLVAQNAMLEQAVDGYFSQDQANVFVLAGTASSGRRTFAQHFAKFINGHERFCVTIDFAWLVSGQAWHQLTLKSPHADGRYLSLVELVRQFPRTVFLLCHVPEQQQRCAEQLHALMHCAQSGVGLVQQQAIDFSQVSWLILVDAPAKTQADHSVDDTTNNITDELPNALDSSVLFQAQEQQQSVNSSELLGIEEILGHSPLNTSHQPLVNEPLGLDHTVSDNAVLAQLPEYMASLVQVLSFAPLQDGAKRVIIAKLLKSLVRQLRMQWKFPLYFQEEVIDYLFRLATRSANDFTQLPRLLRERVSAAYLHAFKTTTLNSRQAFMLQLNETGSLLIVVVVDKPEVLQNNRVTNFIA